MTITITSIPFLKQNLLMTLIPISNITTSFHHIIPSSNTANLRRTLQVSKPSPRAYVRASSSPSFTRKIIFSFRAPVFNSGLTPVNAYRGQNYYITRSQFHFKGSEVMLVDKSLWPGAAGYKWN